MITTRDGDVPSTAVLPPFLFELLFQPPPPCPIHLHCLLSTTLPACWASYGHGSLTLSSHGPSSLVFLHLCSLSDSHFPGSPLLLDTTRSDSRSRSCSPAFGLVPGLRASFSPSFTLLLPLLHHCSLQHHIYPHSMPLAQVTCRFSFYACSAPFLTFSLLTPLNLPLVLQNDLTHRNFQCNPCSSWNHSHSAPDLMSSCFHSAP